MSLILKLMPFDAACGHQLPRDRPGQGLDIRFLMFMRYGSCNR